MVGGDPTPNTYHIIAMMRHLELNVAQLWNSNMYVSIEGMRLLLDIMDIWLPDLKYGSDDCALRISNAPNYWEIATRNIKLAHDLGGGNVIIRVLVLPNHFECCTKPILEWIAENCPRALTNIMRQYRPMWRVRSEREKFSDLNRGPSREEMRKAHELADKLGMVWRPVS